MEFRKNLKESQEKTEKASKQQAAPPAVVRHGLLHHAGGVRSRSLPDFSAVGIRARRDGAASGGAQARERGTPVAFLAQPPIHVRATSVPSPVGALDVVTSCIASYLGVMVTVGGGAPGHQPYRLARDGAQRRVAGRSGSMTALELDAVRLQLLRVVGCLPGAHH